MLSPIQPTTDLLYRPSVIGRLCSTPGSVFMQPSGYLGVKNTRRRKNTKAFAPEICETCRVLEALPMCTAVKLCAGSGSPGGRESKGRRLGLRAGHDMTNLRTLRSSLKAEVGRKAEVIDATFAGFMVIQYQLVDSGRVPENNYSDSQRAADEITAAWDAPFVEPCRFLAQESLDMTVAGSCYNAKSLVCDDQGKIGYKSTPMSARNVMEDGSEGKRAQVYRVYTASLHSRPRDVSLAEKLTLTPNQSSDVALPENVHVRPRAICPSPTTGMEDPKGA
ncbi:hypothetical protein BDW22DRAFT_1433058 [Trametopsis cervina]|nr:hypothetical protein BDW22DRAFT_1433058 [Trametopsis cervina]